MEIIFVTKIYQYQYYIKIYIYLFIYLDSFSMYNFAAFTTSLATIVVSEIGDKTFFLAALLAI